MDSSQEGSAMVTVHRHGDRGPIVIVLHGGPAAVGSALPLATGLQRHFRVLEPWQRGSGDGPLSVARHVADLHEVIATHCESTVPALVGESWGAMLALAYAAQYPGSAGPLVLVGCGTFDPASRIRLQQTLRERQDADLQEALERLERDVADPVRRLREQYRLTHRLYDYDPLDLPPDPRTAGLALDIDAHRQTWEDMLRLQAEGAYPAAFGAIQSPAVMLHGAYDPHPGRMTYDTLRRHIPHLQYREWERCGHRPWAERHARDEFFEFLCDWLRPRLT